MADSFPSHVIAAVTAADPYPYYAHLRETPLFFDEGLNAWVASGAAVVEEAFSHPSLRVRPPAEPVPKALVGTPAGEVFENLVRMNDGSFHREYKPVVVEHAGKLPVQAIAQAAREATAALDNADANRVLTALPVGAMARALGVLPQAVEATVQWVHEFTAGIAPGAGEEAIALAGVAARGLMAQGEAEGLDPVRAANRIALMQQSLDATAGLLGNSIRLLQARPALGSAAVSSDEAARGFAAEVARWDAPVQNTRRFAAEDLKLAGQAIEAGQGLVLCLAAANRDPARNANPDTFDATRTARRLYTFGGGVHECPGQAIAVAIAAAFLRERWTPEGFGARFARHEGFRPLGNARIPVFSPA
ncbi:MAG: cytochrome P450 [Burkholderiaceae bacterium]